MNEEKTSINHKSNDKMLLLADKIIQDRLQDLAGDIGDILFVMENKSNTENINKIAKRMDGEYNNIAKMFKKDLMKIICINELYL